MTGENYQLQDELLPEADQEPHYRYSDLTFENVANQQSYEQYQRVAVSLKQNHTKWINSGLNRLKKQSKQPHSNKQKQSQAKHDKITTNYREMVTFVTSVTFPEASITAFISYVNYQQASTLETHTKFINEINKININIDEEDNNTPQPTPGP